MKSFTAILTAGVVLAGFANAQISQCILTCSSQAATAAGCSSFADRECVCTSAAFQTAAQACLAANCTPAEQTSAVALQNGVCAGLSVTSGTVSTVLSSGVFASASSVSASFDTAALASSAGSASASITSSASASASASSGSSSGIRASLRSVVSGGGAAASSASGVIASASASASPSGAATALKAGLGSEVMLGLTVLGVVVGAAAVGF